MTNWPRIIALGWPGAEFSTHAVVDVPQLVRFLGGEATQAILDAMSAASKNALILDGVLIHWTDENIPAPTAEEIISRATDLQAQLDELDVARAKAKTFGREWTPEKVIEYATDAEKLQELIAAAEAVKTPG